MKRLIRVFNIMVIFIPLTMALCFALVYFTGGWNRWFPDHTLEFYFEQPLTGRITAFLFSLVLIALVIGIKSLIDRHTRHREIVEVCLIMLVAMFLRLMVIIPNRDALMPFSDFGRVWEMIHGHVEGHIEYYSLFPAYLNYAILLRDYTSLIGDAFVNTLYLNVVMATGTAVIIYMIASELTESKIVPFITGILYALMPANIFYCSVMTPEFITIFFDSIGVLLILKVSKHEREAKKAIQFLCAGISIGIGSAYKPFGIIIFIAMVMCFSIKAILEKVGWKRILIGVAAVVIVFVAYKSTKSLILLHTERELGIELDESKSFPHFLLIGLNTEGEGQIHLGTLSRRYYQIYLENGLDAEAAKKTAYDILKTDWSNNGNKIPKLIIQKMIWAWQDDVSPLRYYNYALSQEQQDIMWNGLSVATITQVFYLFLLFTATFGCICSWKEINYIKEFLLLIIFGYFCLIQLSEAQSRYKCLIMPMMCIISAFGIEAITRQIIRRRERNSGRILTSVD